MINIKLVDVLEEVKEEFLMRKYPQVKDKDEWVPIYICVEVLRVLNAKGLVEIETDRFDEWMINEDNQKDLKIILPGFYEWIMEEGQKMYDKLEKHLLINKKYEWGSAWPMASKAFRIAKLSEKIYELKKN